MGGGCASSVCLQCTGKTVNGWHYDEDALQCEADPTTMAREWGLFCENKTRYTLPPEPS